MSGDYSRDSFDSLRDYAGVYLQQGRAALDADWNEMVAIFERRLRAETVDIIGRAVVPRETITGFQIDLGPGPTMSIGRGRMYLDGMLLECHGAANFPGSGNDDFPLPVFDRGRETPDGPAGVLDEPISPEGSDFLPYDRQPYWPIPDQLTEAAGPHLAYIVAWRREVTPLEEPDLLEPALGGIDTATRWQTVWQVRLLENVGANATCATPDADLAGWQAEMAPSTARLTTDTIDIEDPEDPCLVPPTDGYTGLENQFYRVELHLVGDSQGDARFKFSRENASVAAAIETFATPANRITVRRIGRDEILRFRAGDWVEVTDDNRELDHRSGAMLRVALVHEETREIELEGTIPADLVPTGVGGDTPDARRSRLIRWDQRGIVRLADGSEWANLDLNTSDGLIPVPADGAQIVLESGIVVSFSTAPGLGGFREMDHWRFAARIAGTQIEELREAPPDGIQRHYARLAIVTFPGSVQDCRVFWPPDFGDAAACCGCTVCVTAESHNSGILTIQAAIDQIGPAGGTVCLDGGNYELETPVTISNRQAITLSGQGLRTLLLYRGGGAAIRVASSIDVQLERLTVLVLPGDAAGNAPSAAGVQVTHGVGVALRRLAVLVAGSGDRADQGIALEGIAIAIKIEECVAIAPVALASLSAIDRDGEGPGYLALAEFRALDNILFGSQAAIRMDGLAINLAASVLSRNLLLGIQVGAIVAWVEPPTGSTHFDTCTVTSSGDALRLGVNNLRLQDNEISGGPRAGDGVRLIEEIVPQVPVEVQVVGNRIGDLAGAGLRIDGDVTTLLVKRNLIRRCGEAAIATDPKASVRHIAVDNNVIEEIATFRGAAGAAALLLTQIGDGQVVGNTIRAVGTSATGANIAGIAARGVGRFTVEGNVLSEIGPRATTIPAIGVLAIAPYFNLSVRANQITGVLSPGDGEGLSWIGLQIGRAGAQGLASDATGGQVNTAGAVASGLPGSSEADLVFVEVNNQAFALSRAHLAALGPVRERQLTLTGNQLHHEGNDTLPMVLVVDAAGASCIFSENQCRLQSGGITPALVIIAAQRVVAANNVVRRLSDQDAMVLSIGQTGRATVLGNLTFGNIRVLPGGLQPPFDALNLLAS